MMLTSEQALKLGQRGVHVMLLKLTTIDLIKQIKPLFVNQADQLGLPTAICSAGRNAASFL